MRSQEGAIFFIINIIGNFGTVFLDNGYYNKAIAASPVSALPGYILGGISWFAVPFLAATTMGLAAVALESNPAFPSYPNRLNPADVSAGLTLPAAAVALLGKAGAIATLIMVFMAVTSAMSAQLIAVSSIITYDIYKTYFNKEAIGKRLIYISHVSVIIFGLIMSAWSTGLYYINISMGYLYLLMGIIISSAVIPGALTLLWNRQSKWAACLSPPLGLACLLTAWLVTTKTKYGTITVETSGSNIPMLVGNVVALCSPIVFVPILSLIARDKVPYDFNSMKEIKRDNEDSPNIPQLTEEEIEREVNLLTRNLNIARVTAIILTLAFIILWPWPMYGTSYIFSKRFFTGWVVVGIIWIFISFFIVGIFPLFEGRHSIVSVIKKMFKDLMTCGKDKSEEKQTKDPTIEKSENSTKEYPVIYL
ncbi:unnamed protein product [Rotaria sp. Silwood2]|nr:unnamed protein product [Rotaria sp. Silwood2]